MRKLTIISPDGNIETKEVKKAPLPMQQEIVGGYIQMVPGFNRYEGRPCVARCNETGRIDGLPLNKTAGELWLSQIIHKGPFWYEPEVYGTLLIDQVAKKT